MGDKNLGNYVARLALNFITPTLHDGSVIIFDEWYQFHGNPNLGGQRALRMAGLPPRPVGNRIPERRTIPSFLRAKPPALSDGKWKNTLSSAAGILCGAGVWQRCLRMLPPDSRPQDVNGRTARVGCSLKLKAQILNL